MSAVLSQKDRLLELSTILGEDVLFPCGFAGQEGISRIFSFTVKMFSNNLNIKPDDLIGTTLSVKINKNEKEIREFNGIVNHLEVGEVYNGIRFYHATIVPWLALLAFSSDCRIFQNKSVTDIAKKLFDENGFIHYDFSGLKNSPSIRKYCVQYRETSLHFLERLFQEEGIHYYFKHEKNKHTLMLTDQMNGAIGEQEVVFKNNIKSGNRLFNWKRSHAFYTGKYEQTDYNHEEPNTSYYTTHDSPPKLKVAADYSIYDYPGNYDQKDQGVDFAKRRFLAQEVEHTAFVGRGNYLSFKAGEIFFLTEPKEENLDKGYLLIEVSHHAIDNSYLNSYSDKESEEYTNDFTCIPGDLEYQAIFVHTKPVITGPQTAVVVGKEGEIDVNYNGDIKVQFHWDREGKKNEESSCYIRVAQPLAGDNWGMQFIPRIGQEVLVHFLNGDPDRPIIMGAVYNDNNKPPYSLPDLNTRSGIKMRSTTQGGAEANELFFEDKKGEEQIYLHGQKDFIRIIENDESVTIKQGNLNISIQSGTCLIEAAKSIELKVGENNLLINTEGSFLNGQVVKVNN